MDIFAYFKIYRRLLGGEWTYIIDHHLGICHWVQPWWLTRNRWFGDYQVIKYERW